MTQKTESQRFQDNGDGTITDCHLNVMWKKTDSFQDTGKWINWLKTANYLEEINRQNFAGHADWRLPNRAEALSLFDLGQKNTDKYNEEIYLDPIFAPGSTGATWTSNTKDSSALVIQYDDGGQVWPSQYSHMNMAVRLVRDAARK